MAILAIAIALVSCARPEWLSDDNGFLKQFINHELLSVLGVIVTITLASAANLHLEFNRIEERTGESFAEARTAIKRYAYLLISLLGASLVVVVLKPLLAQNDNWQAAFNGVALWIVVLNLLSLLDLTSAVFSIPSNRHLRK